MDFLDPKKMRAHRIRLLFGYGLLAVAVALAATVLLYQANGFGVKQGKVIQNGLVYMSSTPGPAVIELNGKRSGNTNARMVLEAGSYTARLSREGYRDWQRALTVEGGGVEHFSYPFLVPSDLRTTSVTTYDTAPALSLQSPDRRWILTQQPGQLGIFDEYDTKDPEKIQELKRQVALPATVLTLPVAEPRSLEMVEWSNDNEHVLLRHISGDQSEYVLLNRKTPADSVNVSRSLQLAPGLVVTLQDKQHDRYFVHDTALRTLSTANLEEAQLTALLNGVQSFKSYGNDVILYVSADGAPAGRVQLKMYQDKKQYTIRQLPVADNHLLALSRYDNDWYIMAGSPAEGRVYIYRNPTESLQREANRAAVPVAVLKTPNPAAVAFSANSQLMMAQGGSSFAVYDAEYDRSHTYQLDIPLDAPQTRASWMDSHHLQFVSNGKVVMFDYDGTNIQTLAAQTSNHNAFFDTGYQTLYTLATPAAPTPPEDQGQPAQPVVPPANPNAHILSATPLRTAADQ